MSGRSPINSKTRFILYVRDGSHICDEILDLYESLSNPHTRASIRIQDVDKLKQTLSRKGKEMPAFITGIPLLTTNIKDKKRRIWLGPKATEMMAHLVERANENHEQHYSALPSAGSNVGWGHMEGNKNRNNDIVDGHRVARSTSSELGGTAASLVDDDLYYSERVGNKEHGSGSNTGKITESDLSNFYALRDRTEPLRLRQNRANWAK